MKPVINPIYPIAEIGSIDALMTVAVGMEHEAAARYDQLAGVMTERGEAELGTLFRELAALEREHESGLSRWADREGRTTPLAAAFAWRIPETFGDEADGMQAHTLTPYRALGIAVRNEERAFTFYSYLAAMADDPAIRLRAEALAREELNHVHQLRMLRRRAFHMDRTIPSAPRRARDESELARLAHGLEHSSSELDDAVAAILEANGETDAAAMLRTQAAADRQRAKKYGATRPARGSAAAEGSRAAGLLEAGALTTMGALKLALTNAEEVAEAYLATAEHASGDRLLHQAQSLAQEAVARLAVTRSLMDEYHRRR